MSVAPSVRYRRARGLLPRLPKARLDPEVYFIRDDASGWIKIGYAGDAADRLYQLQSGNPGKLTLLARLRHKDAANVERHLHVTFAEERGRGEWFEPSDRLLRMIRVITGQADPRDLIDSVMLVATWKTVMWSLAAHGLSREQWQAAFKIPE